MSASHSFLDIEKSRGYAHARLKRAELRKRPDQMLVWSALLCSAVLVNGILIENRNPDRLVDISKGSQGSTSRAVCKEVERIAADIPSVLESPLKDAVGEVLTGVSIREVI